MKDGLRFKPPKTEHGKRTIGLVLRDHRRKLLKTRMAPGLGKPHGDTLLFGEPDGYADYPQPLDVPLGGRLGQPGPAARQLPRPTLYACVGAHCDQEGWVMISRRLGHKSPRSPSTPTDTCSSATTARLSTRSRRR